jgi:hypothetical protein
MPGQISIGDLGQNYIGDNKEGAEALHGADIAFLGSRRELADRHILDHALA